MAITYQCQRHVDREQLAQLFLSVGWKSGRDPERLQRALAGSHSVITAWDGRTLAGLVNALSDGAMTVYFHYLLVRPEYQNRGIGRRLLEMMLERYADLPTKLLIAENHAEGFYRRLGFMPGTDSRPMFIKAP